MKKLTNLYLGLSGKINRKNYIGGIIGLICIAFIVQHLPIYSSEKIENGLLWVITVLLIMLLSSIFLLYSFFAIHIKRLNSLDNEIYSSIFTAIYIITVSAILSAFIWYDNTTYQEIIIKAGMILICFFSIICFFKKQ